MICSAREYFNSLNGKKVWFLGAGVSHRKLIEMFSSAGAEVTLCDARTKEKFEEGYIDHLSEIGVGLRLGAGYLENLHEADIVFRSPGIDYTKPEIQEAIEKGAVITSEIETFFDLCPCKTVAVTGSDGKTTTTTLISKILAEAGHRVHLGGNIGDPLLPRIFEVEEDDIAVVELSSFQLISMKSSPDVAVVTNLTPNHLDHHKDLAEYYGAKKNILLHQNESGTAVLFDNDTVKEEMDPCVKGRMLRFADHPIKNGAYFDDTTLYLAKDGKAEPVMQLRDLKLIGSHNRYNAAAALAASSVLVDAEHAVKVLSGFTGVEHRIEPCGVIDGVRYYNDSIASSPTRTLAGIRSFSEPLVLIAGGYDKNLDYSELGELIAQRIKAVVFMGDTGPKIEAALVAAPSYKADSIEILRAEDMEDAVAKARSVAVRGDVVLMSPASASFDRYPNFEVRGRHFKSIVAKLMEEKR